MKNLSVAEARMLTYFKSIGAGIDIPIAQIHGAHYPGKLARVDEITQQRRIGACISKINRKLGTCIVPGLTKRTYRLQPR